MTKYNFTAKDKINTRNAESLSTKKGEKFRLLGYEQMERTNHTTGEIVSVGAFKTDIGYFTTISGTVLDAMSDILDYVDENNIEPGELTLAVGSGKSHAGREFLTIMIEE